MPKKTAMRTLLCDADIPRKVVDSIRSLNISAITVTDIPGAVRDDERIVELAHSFDAIIVTVDKDYTNKPLFAAMVERGSRVVRLRPPKCPPDQTMEVLAKLILDNHRRWQDLFATEPGLISCSRGRNRFRKLSEFPWYSEVHK